MPISFLRQRIILIIVFCIFLIKILLKQNILLPFIIITNEPIIQLLVILILFLILIIIFFKKEKLYNIISTENIISTIGIFVALILFMSPSAYDKLIKFQNLQYISYLNCEQAKFISQQKVENIHNLLLKKFNYDIYTQNFGIIVNNFSSITLSAAEDSIRDMDISNSIIEKILDYTIQNNFVINKQIIILNNTLIDKAKIIASTTCEILKPGIDEKLRNLTNRSTFSVILQIITNFFEMIW